VSVKLINHLAFVCSRIASFTVNLSGLILNVSYIGILCYISIIFVSDCVFFIVRVVKVIGRFNIFYFFLFGDCL